jgi:hypothetical protein
VTGGFGPRISRITQIFQKKHFVAGATYADWLRRALAVDEITMLRSLLRISAGTITKLLLKICVICLTREICVQ